MSFQAVRALFEEPVINALAGLTTPVPCYVDNQAFTVPTPGLSTRPSTCNLGQTTSKVLTGNLERSSWFAGGRVLHRKEQGPTLVHRR